MKKIIYILGFFFLLLLLNSKPLKSEGCPNDIYPEEDPWTEECDTVVVESWSNGVPPCLWQVCYCWRYKNYGPAPYVEVYFRGGTYISGDCSGESSNIWEQIKDLTEALLEQNPGNLYWPCPDCPSTLWTYHAYWNACYDDYTDDPCGYGGYCQFKYNVCCDNGDRILTFVSSQHIGDDCPEGCSDKCSSP